MKPTESPETYYKVGKGNVLHHFGDLISSDGDDDAATRNGRETQIANGHRELIRNAERASTSKLTDSYSLFRPPSRERTVSAASSNGNAKVQLRQRFSSSFSSNNLFDDVEMKGPETNNNNEMSDGRHHLGSTTSRPDANRKNSGGTNNNETGVNGTADDGAINYTRRFHQWMRNKYADTASSDGKSQRTTWNHASSATTSPTTSTSTCHAMDRREISVGAAPVYAKRSIRDEPTNKRGNNVRTTRTVSHENESNNNHEDIRPPNNANSSFALDFSSSHQALGDIGSSEFLANNPVAVDFHGSRTSPTEENSMDESFRSDASPVEASKMLERDNMLRKRLAACTSDAQRVVILKKRFSSLMESYIISEKGIRALKTAANDKDDEIECLRNSVGELKNQVDYYRQRAASPNDIVDDANESGQSYHELCRDVKIKQRQIDDLNQKIELLSQEHAEGIRVVNQLRQSQKSESYLDLERQLHQALQQNSMLQRQAKEHDAHMSELRSQNRKLQATVIEKDQILQHERKKWEQERSQLMLRVADKDTRLSHLNGVCQELQAQLAPLRQVCESNQVNHEQYEEQIISKDRELEESKRKCAFLQREVEKMNVQIRQFQLIEHQLSDLEKSIEFVKREREQAEERCNQLNHQLDIKNDELLKIKGAYEANSLMMEQRLYDHEVIRRRLHNQVMELRGNIRVFCRVRPVLPHERSEGGDEVFAFPDYAKERRSIELFSNPLAHSGYGQRSSQENTRKYTFDFDMVFNGSCNQEDLFLEVSQLVQSALDGYNVCIFAYGQTGSGKTYTMQGREGEDYGTENGISQHAGILARALDRIFTTVNDLRSCGWEFSITCGMIEIYNETIRDLLTSQTSSADRVELRLDNDGNPSLTNCQVYDIENQQQALNILQKGVTRRATKSTNMNNRSSRSHCVTTIRLQGKNSLTKETRVGVVHLVDLAGSERLSRSGSGDDREMLREAQAINKSLSCLGNVICAIAKKARHVPFRDSKLTFLLRPSLGGDSKTLMICNLSPLASHRDESLNSLRFAKTVNSCEIAFSTSAACRSS